eukprot:m.211760 g.211760  ORF g.211760 m.211760 type:complete len:77 (-) comp15066_c1_seq9:1879-2109(-)
MYVLRLSETWRQFLLSCSYTWAWLWRMITLHIIYNSGNVRGNTITLTGNGTCRVTTAMCSSYMRSKHQSIQGFANT